MSQYAEQIGFAAGVLIGTRTDVTGQGPVRFGIVQDVSLDFSADLKELYGQSRYAIALAPGKTKVEIKAKFAGIRGKLFNDLYFGATTTATQTLFADAESGTVSGSAVTVSNSANFLADQGVYYSATGLPLKQVPSAPTVGQYTVSAGVYGFNGTDNAAGVYISYTYSSTGGVQIPIANQKMGVGPSFKVVLSDPFDGRQVTYIFNQCQASKLSFPTKQDDYTIDEMDFMVSADIAGNIGSINSNL